MFESSVARRAPTTFAGLLLISLIACACSSINCDDAKGKVTSEMKIGASYAGVGVNVCVSKEEATKFDGKLGVLALRYGENCEAFKSGKISKEDYERRNRDLDQVLATVATFSHGWHDWVNELKRNAFADMDKQLGNLSEQQQQQQQAEAKAGPPGLREKFVDAIGKLDALDSSQPSR